MTPAVDSAEPADRATARTRSERVTIRPFESIDDAESALNSVRFFLGDTPYPASSIFVTDETLAKAALKLALPTPDKLRQAAEEALLSPENCALVVMATSQTHRASTVLIKERLTTAATYPTELSLSRTESDLIFGDRGGFRITVALVLIDSIPPTPLRPSIAGTWLGRAVFNVRPEKQETSFSPEELTEEIRKAYGLPNGVLRFINFDDDLLVADDLSDAVRIYVDKDVLLWMLTKDTDRVAIQLQTELAIMAYDATAQEIVREVRIEHNDPQRVLTESDIEIYPAVQRFFVFLAGKCQQSLDEVLRMASEGQLIRPYLEASFDATDQTLAALKG